jgi:hypothetical protein
MLLFTPTIPFHRFWDRTKRMIDRSPAPSTAVSTSLLAQAVAALSTATAIAPVERGVQVEERNVWQPGSWLIQRCWETLADLGAGQEALTVARLVQSRQPLAPLQALQRLARRATNRPLLTLLVRDELERLQPQIFQFPPEMTQNQAIERLLLIAASAAAIGEITLAGACLERIDQFPSAWAHLFDHADLRTLLAESVAHIGLQPLVTNLVDNAIRRFDDAGAQFVHDVAAAVTKPGNTAPRRSQRLLQHCVDAFRFATLTSLLGRRLATITLGRAGLVDEVLAQLALIANVQDARREAGLSTLREDAVVVRQVKRSAANADVDFQVYTLQQTVAAMPIRQLPREQRVALADQLAFLGVRSDGWTAAGASATLIELGALKYAIEVVEHIAPADPTRAEGMLSLVRGLLAVDEPALALEQARRALAWARSRPDRNPERGLTSIYLDYGLPAQALEWLAQWREPTGWRHRLETLWRNSMDDDGLRLRSLRLRALLQQGPPAGDGPAQRAYQRELQQLEADLRTWTPRLLDGEALVHAYVDWLVRPLLTAGKWSQVASLLPTLVQALSNTSGSKHATEVTTVTSLLAQYWRTTLSPSSSATATNGDSDPAAADSVVPELEIRQTLESFLADLWRADAQRSAWQIIHGLEGSIPLLLALDGATALVELARAVQTQNSLWTQ